MFCTPCARQASLRATLISACFGWWSLPGLILTPMAIVRNARGGVRPPGGDTLLLWNSALRFYTRRSEEHTSELQSLMRISYAVFCLKKKTIIIRQRIHRFKPYTKYIQHIL